MEIKITIEELREKGITLTQYVLLWGLYYCVKIKYFMIDDDGLEALKKGSWVISNDDGKLLLTSKSILLFEPKEGLFDEFVKIFPTRVQNINGQVRVLSPVDPNSMAGKKLRTKWHSMLKNNITLQEKVIECLKQEVIVRKKEGSLYWFRNAETWLNKCTWEDYQYLLEKKTTDSNTGFNKVGEIRL